MRERRRVVVIVLDGATFTVIRPLIQRGHLPHLRSLMAEGGTAELTSTIPFITPTAFSTIMTGVNPGKHGMFDFTHDSHGTYDSGPIVNSTYIQTKPLWELLSECGRRLILVTVPFINYPPTPLNGVMMCVGNITGGRVCTYPPDLAPEIVEKIGGYEERFREVLHEPDELPSEEFTDNYLFRCHYEAEKSKAATLYLMRTYPWDLLITTLVIPDRLQHYFWRCMDPNHPAYRPDIPERYQNAIADGYRKADEAVGEILREVPEDAHIVVMSDHGFGPLDYVFYANRWLQEVGLLHLRKPQREWKVRTPSLERCLERAGLSGVANRLPRAIGSLPIPLVRRRTREVTGVTEAIDWARTRAYATRWGFNVNLRSREPLGIVEAGREYEGVVEAVTTGLRNFCDPRTGKPLFDVVFRREEIYHGPLAEEAHDILCASNGVGVVFEKNLSVLSALRPKGWNDIGSGDHRREGILIMKGPLIQPGAGLNGPRLEDMAPTILYLLGLPIPDYMDGKPLISCIPQETLSQRPVRILPGASSRREGTFAPNQLGQAGEDAEEDALIRAQLKSLGYLG